MKSVAAAGALLEAARAQEAAVGSGDAEQIELAHALRAARLSALAETLPTARPEALRPLLAEIAAVDARILAAASRAGDACREELGRVGEARRAMRDLAARQPDPRFVSRRV